MAACASYTVNYTNVVNVPWAIWKKIENDVLKYKVWVALRASVLEEYDDKGKVTSTIETNYSDYYDENCPGTGSMIEQCISLDKCNGAGKVVVSFVILSFCLAIVSAGISFYRMNNDGYFKKLISIVISLGAFVTTVIAYAAFLPCLDYTFIIEKDSLNLNYSYLYPGPGGSLAISSFVFLIIVSIINIVIPGETEESEAAAAGIDENKA